MPIPFATIIQVLAFLDEAIPRIVEIVKKIQAAYKDIHGEKGDRKKAKAAAAEIKAVYAESGLRIKNRHANMVRELAVNADRENAMHIVQDMLANF